MPHLARVPPLYCRRRYRNAELQNGRYAMAAVAGILIPAALTNAGVLNVPDWTQAGKVYAEGADAIPFASLFMVQMFLYNFVGQLMLPLRCPEMPLFECGLGGWPRPLHASGLRAGAPGRGGGRNGLNLRLLLCCLKCLPAEIKRWEDMKSPGSQAEKGSFVVSRAATAVGKQQPEAASRATSGAAGIQMMTGHLQRMLAVLLATNAASMTPAAAAAAGL